MKEYYDTLIDVICAAMTEIEDGYFNFEVAGVEHHTKRERPYCAELYHQIRLKNEDIRGNFSVAFEPDKLGHPFIEEICGAVEPDFIVHKQGNMGPHDNLAVIEVKTANGDLVEGIKKDIKTINCMATIENGYYGGILIVYGELTERKKRNLIKRIAENKDENVQDLKLLLQAAPHHAIEIHNII